MPGACLREAFDLFDTDGSGTIDAKELKVAMRCAYHILSRIPCLPCYSAAHVRHGNSLLTGIAHILLHSPVAFSATCAAADA